ncbi:ADP-ribosylation factor-like protein [Nannocystis sp. RBIL2]|uniref:GTP-binding protein n=1 Tax=Nannocystis sp. RBIL2 TaxID=2996788 RepID=UPI00226DF8CB|nr:ADP-ribosylation factor-like protein [Nannocystis sp. RBIL2]MCY1064710.1 ADP-ribosylation factor-like protein [Nannocystis sp. RBIL2]
MAVFEPDRARIVLRIVYDGPGRAGKTTNVEQLARIFGTRPGDELQVHPAATGRTIFFDWFSFDGGVLDGQQLQVQVVTVPGHKSLEPRRAHILRGADVVVLVCDSAVSGQDSAREMLDSLREHLGKSAVHVPLLVQANKQDLPNAMLPHELGAALRLGPDVPVIGAQASAGIGVRETAVGAIRAAVRQMKQSTAREGLDALAGQAGTAEQLRAALQTIESIGTHRSAEDDARRAPSRSQPDEGRVVYIRSAKRSTPLAGDADAPARSRTTPVSENMSERPATERPPRLKVPVSAMFIEPTPHVEPPDIPSPPAPTVRLPPPPVLAHADAPIAVTEPFDPEEVRSEPDPPGHALPTFAPTSLRDRWPTEALPLNEEPPDAAAPPQDADEAAPSSVALDHTPEPEPGETSPAPGDDRDPAEAASPAPLAHVPEDSLPLASSTPDQEEAAAAPMPPAHVPEDSHPPGLPAQEDSSAAATPLAYVPEDSQSRDRTAPQDLPAATSPEHVPEDSHSADAPVSSEPGPGSSSPAPAPSEADFEGSHSSSEPPPSLSTEEDNAATTAASPPANLLEVRHSSVERTPSATVQEEPSPAEDDTAATDPLSSTPIPEDSFATSPPAAEGDVTASPVPEDSVPSAESDVTAPPVPEDSVPSSSPAAEDVATTPPAPEDSATESSPSVSEDTQPSPAPDPEPDDLAVPRPGLPPGHVWPVPAGRHVLERLAGAPLVRARSAGHAPSNMLYETGGFCLRTRPEWRFGDDEPGRAALREHVRRAARLGPLLPVDTAVALAVGDGDHVLWHIVPDLPALGAELRNAAGPERPHQLARLASAYATALRLGAREGLALDLDPHAFAEQDGRWVYLGDRLGEPTPSSALIHALLRPPAEPLTAWLDALEQVLPTVLTRDDVAALGLESALAGSEAAPEARLRAILERCA